MHINKILLALFALCSVSAFAGDKVTVTVTPVSQDADAANGGLVYSLPMTVVRVKLTAQVVVSTSGPYYKYSNRFLGISDVVTENSMHWTLIGAEVSSYGVADLSERYKVCVGGVTDIAERAKWGMQVSWPNLSLSSQGVLLAVNGDAPSPDVPAICNKSFTPAYADLQRVRLPQSVIARTSTAAMAEECANSIYALRDARIAIISGDKNVSLPDAGAYDKALARLDAQEADLLSLFAGRRDTFQVVRYYDVVPSADGQKSSHVPVRFSATTGFVDALDLNGKPVYVDMETADDTLLASYPEDSKQRKLVPLDGLRYRVPAHLSVRVSDRNIPLVEAEVLCSQAGQIATLPASLLLSHKIVLSPVTGALVSVSSK